MIFGCLFIFNTYKVFQESRALENYLELIPDLETKTKKNKALRVSDKLRSDFNVTKASWKIIPNKKEPLLKYSALDLLKWKEGHCGKGTRVLVLLLKKMGIDATRITLYGKDLSNRSSHTLVSALIDGEEHLIDSINSNEDWNDKIKERQISVQELFQPDQPKRRDDNIAHSYVNYSYETYPLVMISKGLKMNEVKFNHVRPHSFFSWLMESPYALMSAFYLVLFLLCFSVGYFLNKIQIKNEVITA